MLVLLGDLLQRPHLSLRPVAEVIEEIETLERREVVTFIDDNIIGDPRHAKELFRALPPLKIRWAGQTSVTVARDDELLELAAASGCLALLIGFETLSQANLAAAHKRVNVVDQYESVIKKVHSHGIALHGFFMFAWTRTTRTSSCTPFASRRERARERHVRLARSLSGHGAVRVARGGRAHHHQGLVAVRVSPVYEPKRMSQETLKRGNDWAWREFYSLPSIWRRVGVARRYAVPLWAINLSLRAAWREADRSGGFITPGFSRV